MSKKQLARSLQRLDGASIALDPFSRRMFLRGAGAFLAIPFLPSLSEKAFGATDEGLDARFIFTNVTHGRNINMWNPQQAAPLTVAPGVAAQRLSSIQGKLGGIIGTRFDDIRNKICLIQGLDANGPSDHYWFPWSASRSINLTDGYGRLNPEFPYSIDHILASSSKIYPSTPKIDVLRIDPLEASHTFSFTGRNGDGTVRRAGAEGRSVSSTWNAISSFIAPSAASIRDHDKKKFLVDQFLTESNQVIKSRALSQADKSTFQTFIDYLHEVQKKVAAGPGTGLGPGCQQPTITEATDNQTLNRRLLDLMALAMSCGITKIGTYHFNWAAGMHPTDNFGDRYFPNVHTNIHEFNLGSHVQNATWWGTALDHYGYLVRQMDQLGLLDKSLIVFTSDFSSSTRGHHGIDLPVITAGSLNGKLATGELIQYYNKSNKFEDVTGIIDPAIRQADIRSDKTSEWLLPLYPGRRYNEFLISIMAAAGLTPSEYQRDSRTGFGSYDCPLPSCTGAEGDLNGKLTSYQNGSSYIGSRTSPLPYFSKT